MSIAIGTGFTWRGLFLIAAVMTGGLAPGRNAEAYTYKVLYSFCAQANCADGSTPVAGLIKDDADNLYGTTSAGGGPNNGGTVFELTPNARRTVWTEKVLHSFCLKSTCYDGKTPVAELTMDTSGNLYGTASAGGTRGAGDIFELIPNATTGKWAAVMRYAFCGKTNCVDGKTPVADLIIDQAGNLYSTAEYGGDYAGGAAFKLAPVANATAWKETVLYSFCRKPSCVDGQFPVGGLLMSKEGNLYGTTEFGGYPNGYSPAGWGTAFELTLDPTTSRWVETVIHTFSNFRQGDGVLPIADLIMGNCSPPPFMGNYEVSRAGCGVMISRMAWRADFPLSLPVAMTETAAA